MGRLPRASLLFAALLMPALAFGGSGTNAPPAARAAAADCPASTMYLSECTTSSSAAVFDTACGFFPYARGHYNLVQDTLGLSLMPLFGSVGAWIHAGESYHLIGRPPGTPVPFTLRMPISAGIYASPQDIPTSATGNASLAVDGAVVAQASESHACDWYNCTTIGNLSTPLTAGLVIPSGQEFLVVASLAASIAGNIVDPGGARIEAGLHFDDLPAGTAVVSCRGDTVGTVSVGERPRTSALRLQSVGPSPSRGPIQVAFAVPRGGPALLGLIDVAGRVVEAAAIEAPAAGTHTVTLGSRAPLPPGAYIVRLTQGALTDARIVTIVR
jgi:hypothetical protein